MKSPNKRLSPKAIAQKLDKALRSSFSRKKANVSTSCVTAFSELDDNFESRRAGKFRRSDSCSTVDSASELHVLSEESLPSMPGSVDLDDDENESLYQDACCNQPELKRIAKLVRQRQELTLGESEQTENCTDDEFHTEKAAMKALVRSFVTEAKSGLKCSIFEEQTKVHVSAKLFLEQSLTMTLLHEGHKLSIPLKNVVDAYSSEDMEEHFPDSEFFKNGRSAEHRGTEVFIQHRAPGFPASWVCLNFADEESKDRCVISIKVLQLVAEMKQQHSIEHDGHFA